MPSSGEEGGGVRSTGGQVDSQYLFFFFNTFLFLSDTFFICNLSIMFVSFKRFFSAYFMRRNSKEKYNRL